MSRTICLAPAIWVCLLVSLVGLTRGASAQSDQCPAFTTDQIDTAFEAWSEFIGLVPNSTNVICYDDPIVPATRLEVDDSREQDASLLVFVQRDVAGCSFRIMGETMHCTKAGIEKTWHALDGQVCRTQILRSFAWQRHCRDETLLGRSQDKL
jgi:hypothetical protein